MIGDDSISGVNSIYVLRAQFTGVRSRSGQLLDFVEEGSKDVGVVVGSLVLQYRDESLESHSGVDVLSGKSAQRRIRFSVVLNEYEIPDLQRARQNHTHVAEYGCAPRGRRGRPC